MPRAVDHDRQKADIARATWTVIAREGVERTTMRKIAAELGSTTGLLTHYFADRHAIIAHCLDVQDTALFAELENAAAVAKNGREAVRDVLVRLCTQFGSEHDSVHFRRIAAAYGDGAMRQRLSAMYERFEAIVTKHIASAVADGSLKLRSELSGCDPADLADGLVAAADGIYMAVMARPDRFPDARRQSLIENALAGLEVA